jgi:hypothetical protein
MKDIKIKIKYSPWVFAIILAILATLKLTYLPSMSWWIVFSPVLATSGLLLAFIVSAFLLLTVALLIMIIESICQTIFGRNSK